MVSQFTFDAPHGRSGRRRLIWATLLVLALLGVDIISGGAVRALVRGGSSALWRAGAQAKSITFDSGYFSTKHGLSQQNLVLRDELNAAEERVAAYEVLRQENELLRALLHLEQRERGITAPVVSSVRSSPYGTFLIGAGEREGIVAGSLALTEGGFVVGTVSEVRGASAVVTEIFAGSGEIDASIHGSVAPADGRGGGNATVLIPRGIAIAVGDPVTAPQLGGRPIGIVGSVESDSSSAAQTVYVKLPVNLGALRYVYVVPAR